MRLRGFGTASVSSGEGNGSSCALTTATLLMSRYCPSTVNEAFLLSGPLTLPLN